MAVHRAEQLQDKAACAFADQFYFALYKGMSTPPARVARAMGPVPRVLHTRSLRLP